MRTSLLSRRLRALAVPTVVVATGLLFSPAANAGVLDTPTLVTQAEFSAGPGCTITSSAPAPVPVPFAADGVTVHSISSGTATATKTALPADTSTASASVTSDITATQANGALGSVHLHSSFSATVASAFGTAQGCGMEAGGLGQASYSFDLPSTKIVTIAVEGHHGVGELLFGGNNGDIESISFADHIASKSTIVLGPGVHYMGINIAGGIALAPSPLDSSHSSISGDADLQIAFDDPGVATTAQSGTGSKYLVLSGSQSCSTHAVTGVWTSHVGHGKHAKVKKATISVNGANVASLKKPKKGQVSTVTVPAESPSVVTATIQLAPKGHQKKGKTVTVSRSYQACS